MTTVNTVGPIIRRNYQISVIYWHRREAKKVDLEIYIRAIDGVFYYALNHGRALDLTPHDYYHETYRWGIYSYRPYSMSHVADPSCVSSVLALVFHLLKRRQRDPEKFYNEARESSERRLLPYPDIELQSTWEGVDYPRVWGKQEIHLLKRRLTDLRLQSMVSALERQLPAYPPAIPLD